MKKLKKQAEQEKLLSEMSLNELVNYNRKIGEKLIKTNLKLNLLCNLGRASNFLAMAGGTLLLIGIKQMEQGQIKNIYIAVTGVSCIAGLIGKIFYLCNENKLEILLEEVDEQLEIFDNIGYELNKRLDLSNDLGEVFSEFADKEVKIKAELEEDAEMWLF